MRPAKQGAFDGLCGIYAIINALDIAGLREPRGKTHKELFVLLTSALPAPRLRAAMDYGLTPADLRLAARKVFSSWRTLNPVQLTLRQPLQRRALSSTADMVRSLRELAAVQGNAVIVQIACPGYRHWTVLRSLGDRSAQVRDSGPMTSIDFDRFGLRGRYRVVYEATLILTYRAD